MTMQQRIESTLGLLQPEHLQVLDESHMHSRGLQTHFKAVVVSAQFEGLNRVKRHQKVYGTLGELMGEFHALALHTYTPQEWAEIDAAFLANDNPWQGAAGEYAALFSRIVNIAPSPVGLGG